MNRIAISEHGPEGLDTIRSLWEELNAHHARVSSHFARFFEQNRFEHRRSELMALSAKGEIRIFLAGETDSGRDPVGYCVAYLSPNRAGEIMSIFVDKACRGRGLGQHLMEAALAWLEHGRAHRITVGVVAGNEEAWDFYGRFGFAPRSTTLYKM